MGRKIFVSYKYGDTNVYPIKPILEEVFEPTKVRDYIDKLQDLLAADDHINKGEADGEDLSNFKDSTIESNLRSKIYDSSITIVVVSPNMKELYVSESEQWIPWEVSYSLKEHSRNGITSKTNAILAVTLPDQNGSYNYIFEYRSCCSSGCRLIMTDKLFQIISDNMFNSRTPIQVDCNMSKTILKGDHSYIYSVKWVDFEQNVNYYLDKAIEINGNINDYNVTKNII